MSRGSFPTTSVGHRRRQVVETRSCWIVQVRRRRLVGRFPCLEHPRATNARLTTKGRNAVVFAAPGHVAAVRELVVDALSAQQVAQLREIGDALLPRLDPQGRMTAL